MVILNFKVTPELKQAVKIASAKDNKNVSEFLTELVNKNHAVMKELRESRKKSQK